MAHAQEVGTAYLSQETGEAADLRALRDVPGVAAVYASADGRVVYVVAREHSDVEWDRLLEIEHRLSGVHVTLRAHQGRDPGEMFPGLRSVS